MKKLFFVLLILCLVGIGVNVQAKELSFNEIATKYKEKFDFKKIDETLGDVLQKIEDDSTVNFTNAKIEVKYETFTTTFNYKDGIITYQYGGPKDLTNEETMTASIIDQAAIMKLLYIMLGLQGYSNEQITTALGDYSETDFTMDKHGMEMTLFKIEDKNSSGSVSISGIDTLKINLKKFNLMATANNQNTGNGSTGSGNNSSGNGTSNNTNGNNNVNDIPNPKTGYELTIVVSGLVLIMLLLFVKFIKTKDVLNKI